MSKILGVIHTGYRKNGQDVMAEITPAELSATLTRDDDGTYVLDLQREGNYDDWHVPGSDNIDIRDDLDHDLDKAKATLSTFPPDQEVIITCTAGEVSEQAAELLREMGYDVKTLVCERP